MNNRHLIAVFLIVAILTFSISSSTIIAQQVLDKKGASTLSLRFDGVDDFVDIGDVLNFDSGHSFTISIWAKSKMSNRILIEKGAETVGLYTGYSIGWGAYAAGKANFMVSYGSGTRFNAETITSVSDNVWHHIVAVRDGKAGKIKIAIDGVVENQVIEKNGNLSNSKKLYIGASNNPALFFEGDVRDLRIWNIALTNSSISSLYYEPNLNISSLVLHLPMDEGEGTIIKDISGNEYNGKINGAIWFITEVIYATTQTVTSTATSTFTILHNATTNLTKTIYPTTKTVIVNATTTIAPYTKTVTATTQTVTVNATITSTAQENKSPIEAIIPNLTSGQWFGISVVGVILFTFVLYSYYSLVVKSESGALI